MTSSPPSAKLHVCGRSFIPTWATCPWGIFYTNSATAERCGRGRLKFPQQGGGTLTQLEREEEKGFRLCLSVVLPPRQDVRRRWASPGVIGVHFNRCAKTRGCVRIKCWLTPTQKSSRRCCFEDSLTYFTHRLSATQSTDVYFKLFTFYFPFISSWNHFYADDNQSTHCVSDLKDWRHKIIHNLM